MSGFIPSLEAWAAAHTQAGSPLERWLSARGLLGDVVLHLKLNKRSASTVHAYLVKHHGYGEVWETDSPVRALARKVRRDANAE